jgi:hypothetical protein
MKACHKSTQVPGLVRATPLIPNAHGPESVLPTSHPQNRLPSFSF